MTKIEWQSFLQFRTEFSQKVKEWQKFSDLLLPLQKMASKKDTPPYPIETAVVYNTALDEIQENDEIKIIVIGDNPGKNEQLSVNQKYLVGQAGKIATSFFQKNSSLDIDFRKNVIILNKTPIHTAKTSHLKAVFQNGDDKIKSLLCETQKWMAENTQKLHSSFLNAELWLVGYGELKKNGIFSVYKDALKNAYCTRPDDTEKCEWQGDTEKSDCCNETEKFDSLDNAEKYDFSPLWEKVKVFQHFSMNRFSIDLKNYEKENCVSIKQALDELGKLHRDEIFT